MTSLPLSARSIGSTPATGRSAPSRASSPMKKVFSKRGGGFFPSLPEAAITPRAIGRSKCVPAFLISAGARFTVIRLAGKSKPELRTAATTRSLASFTAASGRPTTE